MASRICGVCGNEVDAGLAVCPWCESALVKQKTASKTGKFRTVDIKSDQPDVETARRRLISVMHKAKAERVRVLKIIHGYGSSGKGGDIRYMVREYLDMQKYSPLYKYYVRGEEFGTGYDEGLKIAAEFKQLRHDGDWSNHNRGVTLVVMR